MSDTIEYEKDCGPVYRICLRYVLRMLSFAFLVSTTGCGQQDYEIVHQPCGASTGAFWGYAVPDLSAGKEFWYSEMYGGSGGHQCNRFMKVTDVPEWQTSAAIEYFESQAGGRSVDKPRSLIASYTDYSSDGMPLWFQLPEGDKCSAFAYSVPEDIDSVGGTTRICVLVVSKTDHKCWYFSFYER